MIEPQARVTPSTLEVQAGATATFTVSTTFSSPVQFQWRLNGLELSGETNTTLVITNTQAQHAGEYTVTVLKPDIGLLFNSPAALLSGPVVITQQPANLNVRPGSNALFTASARGISPITFQWRFNGVILPDETNATLTVLNAQSAHVGSYDVFVGNSYGFVTSKSASLGILINPVITVQPLSQSVAVGGSVTFSVAITGSPAPFTFEWRRGSTGLWTNVASVPMSFFTVTNVQANQAGNYRVVVRNAATFQSGIISSNTMLTVLADTDGDGLPDNWEVMHGLDATNSIDATLDRDGDGASNREEYLAGTDPEDAQSFLHIESIHCDDRPAWHVQFFAASNHTYCVEITDALYPGANWHSVADVPAMPANRIVEIVRPITNSMSRFFRIASPRSP
ncbi:MAG TPA: immunoglobulin domain-containing protein [Candidatus Binatia bacterium]|nr:immunoglobulin domain-containing protein [Candidatus Binatia bacterium]